MSPSIPPENILKCMTPSDRAVLGKGGRTAGEAAAAGAAKLERHRHDVFSQWLNLRSIPFVHARMDRRSTIETGWPDFTLLDPKYPAFCIEFKTESGALSLDQGRVIARLEDAGIFVAVLTEAGEAIRLTQTRLNLKGALP